jgi:hypothetical protein
MAYIGMPTESQLRYVLDRADTPKREALNTVWGRAIVRAGGPGLYDSAIRNRLLTERQILDVLWTQAGEMTAAAQGVYSWMAARWFGDYPGVTYVTRVTAPGGTQPTLNLVAPRVKGLDGIWSQPYELPALDARSMPGISRGPSSAQTLIEAAQIYTAHEGSPLTTLPTGSTPQDVSTALTMLTGGGALPQPIDAQAIEYAPCARCSLTGPGFAEPSTGWVDTPLPVQEAPIFSGFPAGGGSFDRELDLVPVDAAAAVAGDDVTVGVSWKVILILVLAALGFWYLSN